MKFLAPCGHEGIPVTVNYITCPFCDNPQRAAEADAYNVELFDGDIPDRCAHDDNGELIAIFQHDRSRIEFCSEPCCASNGGVTLWGVFGPFQFACMKDNKVRYMRVRHKNVVMFQYSFEHPLFVLKGTTAYLPQWRVR